MHIRIKRPPAHAKDKKLVKLTNLKYRLDFVLIMLMSILILLMFNLLNTNSIEITYETTMEENIILILMPYWFGCHEFKPYPIYRLKYFLRMNLIYTYTI